LAWAKPMEAASQVDSKIARAGERVIGLSPRSFSEF
jgi:hypothetical protein